MQVDIWLEYYTRLFWPATKENGYQIVSWERRKESQKIFIRHYEDTCLLWLSSPRKSNWELNEAQEKAVQSNFQIWGWENRKNCCIRHIAVLEECQVLHYVWLSANDNLFLSRVYYRNGFDALEKQRSSQIHISRYDGGRNRLVLE